MGAVQVRTEKTQDVSGKPDVMPPSDAAREERGRPDMRRTGFCDSQILLLFLTNFGEPISPKQIIKEKRLPISAGYETVLRQKLYLNEDSLASRGLIAPADIHETVEGKKKFSGRGYKMGGEQLPAVIDFCVDFLNNEAKGKEQSGFPEIDLSAVLMFVARQTALKYVRHGAKAPFFARAVKAHIRAVSRAEYLEETNKVLIPSIDAVPIRRISRALPEEQLWMVIDRALRAEGVAPPAAPAAVPASPAGAGRAGAGQ